MYFLTHNAVLRPTVGVLVSALFAVALGAQQHIGTSSRGIDDASQQAEWIARTTSGYYAMSASNPDRDLPFDIECDVLYYNPTWGILWVQSGDYGEYANPGGKPHGFRSGDRIRVRGLARAPVSEFSLDGAEAVVIGKAQATPYRVQTEDLMDQTYRNCLVRMELWVDKQDRVDDSHMRLALSDRGTPVSAIVNLGDASVARALVDQRIHLTGVYAPRIDPAGKVIEQQLMVTGVNAIELVGSVSDDPRFDRPTTLISDLAMQSPGATVVIRGEVVNQNIGTSLSLRDATGQIELEVMQTRYASPGQSIEVAGRIVLRNGVPMLEQVGFRPEAMQSATVTKGPLGRRNLLNIASRIRELPEEEHQAGHLATLRGVVTWSDPDSNIFYLHDSSGGIQVLRSEGMPHFGAGAMLDVRGAVVGGDFAPAVHATQMVPSGTLSYPRPEPISLEDALAGSQDAQWVEMQGFVFDAERDENGVNRLHLATEHGDFVVRYPAKRSGQRFLRSVVAVSGVCHSIANETRQLQQIEVLSPDETLFRVVEGAPEDPFAMPSLPLDRLGLFNPAPSQVNFVKVEGIVMQHTVGDALYLSDGEHVLRVHTRSTQKIDRGTHLQAVGRQGREGSEIVLREALLRPTGVMERLPAPAPLPPNVNDLAAYTGRLVSQRGNLISTLQTPSFLHLTVQEGSRILDAQLPVDPSWSGSIEPPEVGSEVELRGVLIPATGAAGGRSSHQIMLAAMDDITVLGNPPWWNTGRVSVLILSLAAAIGLAFLWVRILRRRVREQTAQIKQQLNRERELSDQLQRATRLESLGLLAGGIAHDFNNLLTVVLGNLSLLRIDTPPDSETDSTLSEAERAVGRAQQLTMQLLTFAKGGSPVRTAEDLPGIVREVTNFALRGSSVRHVMRLAQNSWPAHVDKGQVSQVVQNLVINAMQAMPDGGTLHLELDNVELEHAKATLPPGRYLRLRIRDTGCGIPEDELPRVFDPYFSTKEEGHGLGLATVYSILRKHHGDVEVESKVGRGTVFTVWLPAAGEDPSADTPATTQVTTTSLAAGQGQRVLVMDDELEIRNLADRMLRHLGYRPITVANGEEALRAYQVSLQESQPVPLVILDLTIKGGMGGLETLRQLRQINPELPIIVSSGYSEDKAFVSHLEFGFDGAIPKPYEIATFAQVVRDVLHAPRPSRLPG